MSNPDYKTSRNKHSKMIIVPPPKLAQLAEVGRSLTMFAPMFADRGPIWPTLADLGRLRANFNLIWPISLQKPAEFGPTPVDLGSSLGNTCWSNLGVPGQIWSFPGHA